MLIVTGSEPVAPRVERFAIPAPALQAMALATPTRDIAISPDGAHLIYAAFEMVGGSTAQLQLRVRSLDSLTSTPLTDPSILATEPFVSSDSAWVGFVDVADGTLKKVQIVGGP